MPAAFYARVSFRFSKENGGIHFQSQLVGSLTLFGIRLSKIYIYIYICTHTYTPRVFIAFSTLRFGFPSLILSEIETLRRSGFLSQLRFSLFEKSDRNGGNISGAANEPTGQVSRFSFKNQVFFLERRGRRVDASQSLIARAIFPFALSISGEFLFEACPPSNCVSKRDQHSSLVRSLMYFQ